MTYDPVGNLTSTTDANGDTTSYVYDDLDRKTAEYDTSVADQAPANQLASWTYDGPATSFEVGQLVSSTAFVGGAGCTAYTEASAGYNVFGESLGQTVTIPDTTAAGTDASGGSTAVTTAGTATLAGSYAVGQRYDTVVGLPAFDLYPAGGGLAAETDGHGYSGALDLPTTLAGYTHSVLYNAFGRVTDATLNAPTNVASVSSPMVMCGSNRRSLENPGSRNLSPASVSKYRVDTSNNTSEAGPSPTCTGHAAANPTPEPAAAVAG